jgi:hypothetical protein
MSALLLMGFVADLGQLFRQEEPFVQWKAAAFARWHEPDVARVSVRICAGRGLKVPGPSPFSARIAGRRRQSLGAKQLAEEERQQADGNGGAQADRELRPPLCC